MLSRSVITFLPRSKNLLISWLQSPSAVIFEPRKAKSATVSTVYPSICQEVMGPDAMILAFWMLSFVLFSSVQSLSHVQLFVTQWTAACQASLSITNSRRLPKLMSIDMVMPSNHLILYRPLLLLPSIFPNIRVFSNESALRIKWPKYWSFSFNISPSNEYSGLISFRIDWFDRLGAQGPLKSLLQHHSSKSSILWCSALILTWLLEKP